MILKAFKKKGHLDHLGFFFFFSYRSEYIMNGEQYKYKTGKFQTPYVKAGF